MYFNKFKIIKISHKVCFNQQWTEQVKILNAHTCIYVHIGTPTNVHTDLYKIRKRKIITRSNSTGFEECPDLWIRRTNDGNLVNWWVSFGVERVLEERWISGDWQSALWHHQPMGKWERKKMSQLESGSKRPNHRAVSLLRKGNDRIQNQSGCCCTFIPKRAFLDIQMFRGVGGNMCFLPERL